MPTHHGGPYRQSSTGVVTVDRDDLPRHYSALLAALTSALGKGSFQLLWIADFERTAHEFFEPGQVTSIQTGVAERFA